MPVQEAEAVWCGITQSPMVLRAPQACAHYSRVPDAHYTSRLDTAGITNQTHWKLMHIGLLTTPRSALRACVFLPNTTIPKGKESPILT